jgi:predicted DsbA family dithiol-disulfide isomerase
LADYFGPARAAAMRERLRAFAATFGITDMRSPERMPNTRRALAVAELAREKGVLEPYRRAAMDAYWRDERDLESLDVLADIATAVGLDADEARRAADDPRYQRRIDEVRREASAMGVTGIPTFFFGEDATEVIVGCQPYPVLAAAARQVGARRKSEGA